MKWGAGDAGDERGRIRLLRISTEREERRMALGFWVDGVTLKLHGAGVLSGLFMSYARPGIVPGMHQCSSAYVELVSGGERARLCLVALSVGGGSSLPAGCQAAACSERNMVVFLWTSASGRPCRSLAGVTQPHCLFIGI